MTQAERLHKSVVAPGLVAVAIVLACASGASALNPALDVNQYAHTAWFFREGFAQGRVTSIAQTPDGYLWLGTEFGLLRFDGARSVSWRPPSGEHLPNSWIRSLLATPDGTLWIGTLAGLASWKDGTLTRYPELAGHSVNALLADREGTVWAGGYAEEAARATSPAGSLCNIRGGSAQCVVGDFGEWVGSLHEDRTGALWATAENGLWRWRPGAPKRYAMPASATGSSQALIEDAEGRLLIAAVDGIRSQVGEENAAAYPLLGAGAAFKPERLLRDRDGGLWIGTVDRGLLHVRHGRTDVYTQANGLSGDFVTRLFEDREGNVWVATKNGLDRFRDLAVRTISANQGLPSAPPWSVLAARDGSVWLGSLDGVTRWRDGQVTTYRTPGNASAQAVARGAPSGGGREIFDAGLPDDAVGSLSEDADGRLWVSTLRGVAYFESGRFVRAGDLPEGRTSAIVADGRGDLWIVNDAHGLYRVRNARVVEHIPWGTLKLTSPPTAVIPDSKDGGLWLGFEGRIAHVKDSQVRASYTRATGLASGRINDLRFDGTGALWVATETGLSYVKDGRAVTLTGSNGLSCDTVHWTMEDRDNAVWLYTVCGLLRIASSELKTAVSDPSHTLQPTEFDSSDGVALRALPAIYRPQVATTAEGRLWFLPGDGVSVLDSRDLAVNRLPPTVRIEQVTADRKAYGVPAGLTLPARTRDLEIEYTALSFVAPEKNRFRIKLEGRDAEWRDVGNRRQAFYADLSPGTYRFRVAAANNSGVWNEAGAFVDFSVAPAYYQTSWFYAASVVGALVVFWTLYQFRLRQVAHDYDLRLDERVSERTRIARELHDTLLQSFQGLILRFQSARDLLPEHPARAGDALDGALDRADQAITEGRDAIQNLRAASPIELAQAMTALADEYAQSQNGGHGTVIFRASVEGRPRDLHPLLRDDVYRIAREALGNAYRHAQATRIEAEVTYGARELRLRIRDDGKGIDPEHLTTGRSRHWGLTNMRERARQIGSELSLWSEVGAGTEVELRVPGSIAYGPPPGAGFLRRNRKQDPVNEQ